MQLDNLDPFEVLVHKIEEKISNKDCEELLIATMIYSSKSGKFILNFVKNTQPLDPFYSENIDIFIKPDLMQLLSPIKGLSAYFHILNLFPSI
jgi:hypothetical protein